MSTVRRVKFLWDAARLIDLKSVHMNDILKSYIRNICRKVAGTNTAVPLERFSETQMCNRCSLHWQENRLKINYKANNVHITTLQIKKLRQMLSDDQNGKSHEKLTRKQKNRIKWLLKRAQNKLVIGCEFCRHNTSIALEKPDDLKKIGVVAIETNSVHKAETSKKTTAKTKANDKNEGLKTQKATVAQKNPQKTNVPIKKTPPAKQQAKATKKPRSQQKNSLLQLAALLKSQDNQTSTNKNRLESFLK